MCFPSFAKDRIDYIATNDGKYITTTQYIHIFFETSLCFQCKLHFVENKEAIERLNGKEMVVIGCMDNLFLHFGNKHINLQSKRNLHI